MPSVLIRNLDEHTHRRLKARAAANRRSLEQGCGRLMGLISDPIDPYVFRGGGHSPS
jgi:hypothetical protein